VTRSGPIAVAMLQLSRIGRGGDAIRTGWSPPDRGDDHYLRDGVSYPMAVGSHPLRVVLRGVVDEMLVGDRPDPLDAATRVASASDVGSGGSISQRHFLTRSCA
jgi:hypothetical protein